MFELNKNVGWVVPANTTLSAGLIIPDFSKLGDGCKWLGVVVISWLTMANIDGSHRQLKIIKHKDGVKIEAGCFCGVSAEFLSRANNEHKLAYVVIIGAVVKALLI